MIYLEPYNATFDRPVPKAPVVASRPFTDNEMVVRGAGLDPKRNSKVVCTEVGIRDITRVNFIRTTRRRHCAANLSRCRSSSSNRAVSVIRSGVFCAQRGPVPKVINSLETAVPHRLSVPLKRADS